MLTTVIADDGSFVVDAGLGLIIWSLYALFAFAALVVAMLKRRWGWALVGLLTVGIGAFVGALLPAAPDSVWARWRYGVDRARTRARADSGVP